MTEISRFLNDPERMKHYYDAISTLERIGFRQVLIEISQGYVMGKVPETVEASAFRAHQTIGYAQCVDDTFFFDQLREQLPPPVGTPEFGSKARLIDTGFATQEELDNAL